MKQIKTIIKRRDFPGDFDQEVNAAISEGWLLIRRYVNPGFGERMASMVFYPVLVAELEREISDENL